ncbi:hypothetical protein ABPG75_013499 [Micractinium tetrahymenae]
MPSSLLSSKRVLVTGASRGIGAAIAERCAAEGAELLLTARSADKLREVAERCRAAGAPLCACLPCDLADPSSIDRLAAEVLQKHPEGVDVLVNNAGTGSGNQDILTGEAEAVVGDPDAWEAMLYTNTLGPMRLTRLLAPAMAQRGGGLIVNTGSLAGTFASASSAPYCASKWGIRGWVLSTYEELRRHGIRTMVIEPGFVATDMVLHLGKLLPELCIQPSDIAEAALLPLRLGSNAVPLELVMKARRGADLAKKCV